MNKSLEGLRNWRKRWEAGEIEVKKREKRPSMVKAIRAKCKDCMNDFRDGRNDCEIEDYSLYYWAPYGRLSKERKALKLSRMG